MSEVTNILAAISPRVAKLEDAIRKHRDSWLKGDEKCWSDNEELYKLLPEGFTPPERDELVELENCQRYIASCHHPEVQYISPQVRIEELEKEVEKLNLELMSQQATEPYKLGYLNGGDGACKKIAQDLLTIADAKRPSEHISSPELAAAYKNLEDLLAAYKQIVENQREALKGKVERP